MALSQYYRLVGFATDGNTALELSEARLYAGGVAIDSGATLSATVAPASGTLPDLFDDLASAVVTWPYASYSQSGFALVWDMGSAVESASVNILLGSGGTATNFPYAFTLQHSSDLVSWATVGEVPDAAFPGVNSLSDASSSAQTYAANVVADSPVRYFRMRETSGTVAVDEMGNGDGAYSGTYTLGATGFTPDGKALSVSGLGKLDCGFNTDYLSEFSVEIMFSPAVSGHGAGSTLVGKRRYYASSTSDFPFAIEWNSTTSKFSFYLSKGDDYSYDATLVSSVVSTGLQHHLTAIYRANGLCELYVDNSLHASATIAFAINSSSINWSAARSAEFDGGVNNSGFSGTLAELAIYDYALSSGTIAAHYASRSALGNLYPAGARGPRFYRLAATPELMQPASTWGVSTAHGHLQAGSFFDAQYGGNGAIRGTVAEAHSPTNTPLQRRVLLLDERSQQAVSETWSDAVTGSYEFVGVRADLAYTVITYDNLLNYRAVVADNLTLANGGVELL